jgi:hypothetical protein
MDFASPSCLDLYPPVLHNFRAWAEACSLQVKSTPLHSLPKDELGSLVGSELR